VVDPLALAVLLAESVFDITSLAFSILIEDVFFSHLQVVMLNFSVNRLQEVGIQTVELAVFSHKQVIVFNFSVNGSQNLKPQSAQAEDVNVKTPKATNNADIKLLPFVIAPSLAVCHFSNDLFIFMSPLEWLAIRHLFYVIPRCALAQRQGISLLMAPNPKHVIPLRNVCDEVKGSPKLLPHTPL
jgi:hypothetical protein